MSINQAGLDLIKTFEGCKLEAYLDDAGVLTIGWGHTSAAGPPMVRSALTITREQAESILATDLKKYEEAVEDTIAHTMNPNQFAAFVSLCFNIGPGAFMKSTVARRFNSGNVAGAGDAFLMWNKITDPGTGQKVELKGLTRRRAAERALFLTPASASKPDVCVSPMPPPPAKPAPAPRVSTGAAIAAAIAAAAAALWNWWPF